MWESLSAGFLVTAAALGLLALAVSRLGRGPGLAGALQVMGLLLLKFAVLLAGLKWSAGRPWFSAGPAALGIGLALLGFVLLKRKHGAN